MLTKLRHSTINMRSGLWFVFFLNQHKLPRPSDQLPRQCSSTIIMQAEELETGLCFSDHIDWLMFISTLSLCKLTYRKNQEPQPRKSRA